MSLNQKDKRTPEEELKIVKDEEIRDYRVEFDGDEPCDVNSVQAAMIIKNVLVALDVPFEKINITQVVTHMIEASKADVTVEFMGEVPEYWYAEADIGEKVVEVGIDDYRMRIPLSTILFWFSQEEKEDMR